MLECRAMLALAQIFIFALLCLIALNFLLNCWTIRVIEPTDQLPPSQPLPLISILIPARNEANNIVTCVESLLTQNYPSIEIIVLDDQSEDDTGRLVTEIAQRDPRVQLIRGTALPVGWMGKCWACHQLYQVSKGEYLLFTDADTRFAPQAITAAINYTISTQADLLSLLPRQLAEVASVKLMIPLLYFILYTLLPGALLQRSSDPSISAAIGQFLLFRRDSYKLIGGHQALANSIVEDLDFARAIKKAKLKLVLADGNRLLQCRMYNSLAEVWSGFTKNFYASFSYSIVKLGGFILFNSLLYLLPLLLLLMLIKSNELLSQRGQLILASQLILPYLIRLLLARRHTSNPLALILHPFAIGIMILIAGNSIYRIVSGRGVDWKGRSYQPQQARD